MPRTLRAAIVFPTLFCWLLMLLVSPASAHMQHIIFTLWWKMCLWLSIPALALSWLGKKSH
jgi:hypothetical protein